MRHVERHSKRRSRARRGLAFVVAGLALSGCINLNEYGKVAPYHRDSRAKIPVQLPPGAPSISNQFLEATRDGEKGHLGLDIAAPVGTPVLAAAPGRVYLSYFEPMYGNRIIIDHGKGADGRRSFTVYKHLDSRNVADGAPVTRGQQIGTLGETGLLSSYPHLHFEVMREKAPGRRVVQGSNWWQGMMQEDPNLFWAAGPGRPTCANTGAAPAGGQGVLPITYPAACGR
ncbi:MAG: M23 family metallopeptidase [Maritimibacter sp.]|nr:M23 family metallopeptidase [Maritimibacter sp.]